MQKEGGRYTLLELSPWIRGCCRRKEDATIVVALSYHGLEADAEGRKTVPLMKVYLTSD
jgi:hypothetical protein